MIKNFTFTLPDEPYVTTTAKNETVNVKYDGPKWLCFCVENGTNKVRNLETSGNTEEDLMFEHQIEEGHYHIKVTATDHPLIAAYFTHCYTNDTVPDYEEEITDADGVTYTWNHSYGENGILNHVHYNESVVWNPGTNTFTGPEFRQHANSREETMKQFALQADLIEANLDSPDTDYTSDDETALRNHVTWLRSIPTKYADIAHWKIPFPSDLPTLQ